jgi:hypothetical protein
MTAEEGTVRLLGAAFLIVFVASILSGALLNAATGTGSISEKLASISSNAGLMRLSILVELVTSIGIVALAALLYRVLSDQSKTVALIAFGWWLAEGIILGMSKLGGFALIPLSQAYVQAGAPQGSSFQALGEFLYTGLDRQGWTLHMVFFCLGAILWYSLFYRSRYVPRWFAAWGVASVSLVTLAVLMALYDPAVQLPTVMLAPYMVFEGLIGPWLMIRGITLKGASTPQVQRSAV